MSDFWKISEQILSLDFSSLNEFSPLAIFFIILFTTFITEDGACLAAGALAGQGTISLALAISASFAGIFVGDIGLYWIGRIFGNPLAKTKIFRRFVSERQLERASFWLEKRGAYAIFISRFVSGIRLPTYLAAGFLRTSFSKFIFYFLIASAIWTPLLVGSTAFAIKIISPKYILLAIIIAIIVFRIIFNLSTWRKRRLFIGRLRRIRNWEFWPLQIFYFPVVVYVIWLAIRYRSLTVFTCANPGIPAGGFIGESKDEIYQGLNRSAEAEKHLLKHLLIRRDLSADEKIRLTEEFIKTNQLSFPLVLKPDAGERGKAVEIIRDAVQLREGLNTNAADQILQEFAAGEEVSIFYYRYPSQKTGKIFSITEKQFPMVTGDGESTLEELILADQRAVCLAEKYFDQNEHHLNRVPAEGEEIKIIDIGTHSRGAIFLEGNWMKTPALEKAVDRLCQGFRGFYFGRFDIRTDDFAQLKKGGNFKIIELNGVTSESTNIYDKRYSLSDAYKILFRQWRIAFDIGRENFYRGAKPTSFMNLIRMLFGREINAGTPATRRP